MISIVRAAGILLLIVAPASKASNWTITGCTFSTPPAGMVFSTAVNLSSTTSMTVSCTATGNGTPANYTVGLSAGVSGNIAQRTMKKGSSVLKYNLYRDANYTLVWGDVNANWSSQTVNKTSNSQTLTVYGKIDASSYQASPAGTYSDPSITATITY
jgi:spore coat protein U-like protein